MAKAPKQPANDELVLELIDKVDKLAKHMDKLEAEKENFAEGLAGRLLKLETVIEGLEALLVGEHTGAPDLLARKVLGGFLKLLEQQRREFTTARQVIAKEVLVIGKPLMKELERSPGHVEKQETVKDLEHG